MKKQYYFIIASILVIVYVFIFLFFKKKKSTLSTSTDVNSDIQDTVNDNSDVFDNSSSTSSNSNTGNTDICPDNIGQSLGWILKHYPAEVIVNTNLMSGPSLHSNVLMPIAKNTSTAKIVVLSNKQDNWVYVLTETGKQGYLCKNVITYIASKATGALGKSRNFINNQNIL